VQGAARRAGTVLGQRRQVRVVVHVDGQAEPLLHQRAEPQPLERQVDAVPHGAGRPVDQGRDSEAHRRDVRRRRSGLLDGVHDQVEHLALSLAAPEPVDAIPHRETLVHDPSQELGPPGVHADHTARRHVRTVYT
jgi:hypothetical protein